MEESWGIMGTHKKAEVPWQGEGTCENWWHHGRDQEDMQGAGNAALRVLGHSESITGHA